MTTSGEWKDFEIFDGNCKLGMAQFIPNPDSNAEKSLEKDNIKFCKWIDALGKDPESCGIPSDRIQPVKKLIERFFKLENDKASGPPKFVDVATVPQQVPITAHPVNVPFDNQNHEIPINDGPSALGYMFSVAKQPAGTSSDNRTWDNYVVPLLALYSRWIFLAYIKKSNGNGKWTQSAPSSVPWMTCAMYFHNEAGGLHVLLSAHYVTGDGSDGDQQASRVAKTYLMNTWRSQQVLNPALKSYQPPRTLPPPTGTVLGPVLAEKVTFCILQLLKGNDLGARIIVPDIPNLDLELKSSWETVSPLLLKAQLASVVATLTSAWISKGGTPILPVPMEVIFDTKTPPLGVTLRSALMDVLTIRWSPDYNREAPATVNAFEGVFNAYFAPHFCPLDLTGAPDTSQPEVSSQIEGYDIACNGLFTTLFEASKGKILDMIDRLHYWVDRDNKLKAGPHVPRYGRCAETYPVAGFLPHYCKDRKIPSSAIRGFAFHARNFNNGPLSAKLGENFDRATLNTLHEQSNDKVYRLPCTNCTCLLPYFDVPVGDQNYNVDMRSLYAGIIQ